MNKNFLRSTRIILSIAFLITAEASQLYAIDNNNRYFAYGVGQKTCDDYVKFRGKRLETLERQHERYTKDELYEIVDKVVEHWIAGFLTATDLYLADTYNIAGSASMDNLKDRLETLCRLDGKQFFVQAVITLVKELHRERVRSDPGR
jgi:hypothetical protein